jgi:hypothetical protein
VTSSSPADVDTTVGVPHDGSSWRSAFQITLPVCASSARTNESACVSTWMNTMSFQMIGELAGPHSYEGMSYAPMSTRPISTFHKALPFTSYACTPCDPNHATTMRPSVAGEALAYVDLMCRLFRGSPSNATRSQAIEPVCLSMA